MIQFDIIVFPFGSIGLKKINLVCSPSYHTINLRMTKFIHVFRSMDRVCLFSRLELTVHAIDRMAFLIEFICWSYIFTGLWGKENHW